MAESEVSINVQEIADSLPADENTNSMREAPLPETTTCMSKSLPVLRVEELKDELNNSFSYTSGEEDHSPQASDDPERKDVQEEDFVPPTDELRDKIIKQVEFYFSDANILKDAFLLKHVRRNKLGYVSIKLITSFKKMKSLTKDYRAVAYSLRQSDNLEVNEEGKKVRRKNPLPEFDETTPSRSVLAINLPMENPSIENIAEMFSKCGEVALIRILKPNKSIPQDIKKHSNKHPEIGTTICAVIEFEKHDHAQKAVDTMCDKDDWKRGMRVVLLSENKKKSDKSNDKNHSEKSGNTDIHEGSGDDDKKKKKRGGRRNKNRHFDSAHHDDSACYSSGSEHDPPSRHNASLSPNQNQMDGNKLSPTTSPRSSPRSSPMTSPRSQRRRLGPHGKSPLAEHSPGSSPKPSPRSSPESGRKRYDYSSGGDSTPSSPWVQRRLKAAQELSKSPLVGNSPVGSPMLGRKSTDGPRKLADLGGITRQPKGPDGTRGFHLGRDQNTKRESGRKVQFGNINAGKAIADVIRTCLGPRSMLKMLMDPMGGIVMTNDGNAILREINVQHPAAKSFIEVARTQDEEVGDGTTSVIILGGEMLSVAEPFLEQQMHPTVIISAFRLALEDLLEILKKKISTHVDTSSRDEMMKIIKSSVGTKFINKWSDLACKIALEATTTVALEENGRKEIDIKRYAKVEKIPGGTIDDSEVLKGVMINKDVVHPKMKRRLENPRILLLDCNLEYKKGESQTNIEISKEEDFAKILKMEEEFIEKMCSEVISVKPDLVITEKGISDLAQHYLIRAGITCIRRVRKSDNNRIARACGATVVNRTDELREEDIGTECGLFEVKKIGDEYFTFLTECKNPKACTILLRGASKDILNEVERNLQDAMNVTRNVMQDPYLVPGGGAAEMALAQELNEKAKSITGVHQWPYRAVARALEVIPRTLIQNCGASTIRTLTALRAKHAQPENVSWGVNGENGNIVDMKDYGVWEPYSVKAQTYKTAIETAILLLRIDDIVSGTKKQMEALNAPAGGGAAAPPAQPMGPED